MSKPVWKDASSWSQSTTAEERKNPNTWEVDYGGLRITVHHYIRMGDAWFVTCHTLRINKYDLNTEDPEVAKKLALEHVVETARKYIEAACAIQKANK